MEDLTNELEKVCADFETLIVRFRNAGAPEDLLDMLFDAETALNAAYELADDVRVDNRARP